MSAWFTRRLPSAPRLWSGRATKAAAVAVLLTLMVDGSAAQSSSAPFRADRKTFFKECSVLRNYEMGDGNVAIQKGSTSLTEHMKAGIGVLLDAWDRQADPDKRRLAFILATARRESRNTFSPLREAPGCGDDESCRERAIEALLARRAQQSGKSPKPNYALPDANGHRYYGRGFIQLTLKRNYKAASERLGLDLVNDPDKVMEAALAADILVRAMLEGWYGSRRPLSFYINGSKEDWINARNNVNPGSPNKPITAVYAKEIVKCLRAAQ